MSETDLQAANKIFARFEPPPGAKTLGWEFLDADFGAGTVDVGFNAKQDFCNPGGSIQGGFLSAMLDDTMGLAVVVKSKGQLYAPTISLNVTFIAPAMPGKLVGRGRILHMGRSICSLEAELFDGTTLLARSTASSRLVDMGKALTI